MSEWVRLKPVGKGSDIRWCFNYATGYLLHNNEIVAIAYDKNGVLECKEKLFIPIGKDEIKCIKEKGFANEN